MKRDRVKVLVQTFEEQMRGQGSRLQDRVKGLKEMNEGKSD